MARFRISPARVLRCLKLFRHVSCWDACRLVLFRYTPDEVIGVRVRKWNRGVWLRPGTTDLQVFQKVVIDEEYAPPEALHASGILDAGAYIGLSTLYLHHWYPEAEILAIEPDPRTFQLLERNTRGVERIHVLNGALWSGSSSCTFQADTSQPWASRIAKGPAQAENQVRAVSLNDIEDLLGRPVDFIKMDIEGAEEVAFRDVDERVSQALKAMVIEFHERFYPGSSESTVSFAKRREHHRWEQGENTWFIFQVEGVK